MADDTLDQDGEPRPQKSGNKLLMILLLVNMVGLVGLGAFVALGMTKSAPPPPPEDVVEEAMDDSDLPSLGSNSSEGGPIVELKPLVVNLREPSGDRYLKVKLHLELDAEETKVVVDSKLSQIRYQLTMLLAGQRVVDVQGPENMEALRKAMVRRANAVLHKGRIVGVWPAEWIVQ